MKVGWQFGEPLVIEDDTQYRRRPDRIRKILTCSQGKVLDRFPYSVSNHVKEDKKETDDGGQLMYKDNNPRKGDRAQILHKSGKNSKIGAMLVVKKNLFKLRKEKMTKEALGRAVVDKGKRCKVRETKKVVVEDGLMEAQQNICLRFRMGLEFGVMDREKECPTSKFSKGLIGRVSALEMGVLRGPTNPSQFERNGVIINGVGGNSHEKVVRESGLVPISVNVLDTAARLPMVLPCTKLLL
ncbi:hypothetical protein QYF36_023279 [Acer negundo]|nr:hypothetical protein QYF36_023279 [Acer negundo]